MNISALSARTIQLDIAQSNFTTGPENIILFTSVWISLTGYVISWMMTNRDVVRGMIYLSWSQVLLIIYSLSMKVCTCALFVTYPYSNLFFLALKKAIADYDAKQRAGNAMDKTLYSLGWSYHDLMNGVGTYMLTWPPQLSSWKIRLCSGPLQPALKRPKPSSQSKLGCESLLKQLLGTNGLQLHIFWSQWLAHVSVTGNHMPCPFVVCHMLVWMKHKLGHIST